MKKNNGDRRVLLPTLHVIDMSFDMCTNKKTLL